MLDTRTKILAAADAPQRLAGLTVIAVYLDPLIDTHAARLRELAAEHGPLAVCVCDPPDPLLPAPARAELAAASRDIALVAVGEANLAHAARVIDERPADLERRRDLMVHVHTRQKAARNA